jgi:orotate phosphoribosyltransferase
MNQELATRLFKDCGAYLQGHFVLSSGMHSSGYMQCALVCQDPELCARFCAELARPFANEKIQTVVGPAMGGIVLAYELARALKARGIFTERDDTGRMTLRRGFVINPGERVLVAEDVMTTGGSAAEIVEQLEQIGAVVVGVVSLVDRGGARRFDGRLVAAALRVDLPAWKPEECPLCKQGIPAVKPGSRKQPGK